MAEATPTSPHDYVFLYAPPWFGPTRFSKHHLAHHFAVRGARVLFIEAPLTPLAVRRPNFLRDFSRTFHPPRQVEPNLWVRRHFLAVPYHAASTLTATRAANRVGQRLLAPVVRRDIARLGLRRPVLVAGLPHAADLVRRLPRAGIVYHCADDYAAVKGFPASLPTLEMDLCQQANLVITTSETLCQTRRRWNPNTYWVPNGADVAHFGQPAVPAAEIAHLPGPKIGFVGGLSEWVDFELLRDLAARRGEWSFVLIGPLSGHAATLHNLPNVHLLGSREYATLPRYLAAMDVALIPFKRDRVTHHADPIKAYEYLAAGLPVVATDMPALRRLAHVIALADSLESFDEAIRSALDHGRAYASEARVAEARLHSWTSRFEQIDALIARSLDACGS